MDIMVRAIEVDEKKGLIETCEAAFGWNVHPSDAEAWGKVLESDRSWAAFDDDRMVGTGSNYSFELSIPGGRIPAAGLTFVGVLPSHRRRGVLTSMMQRFLDDPRRRGESVSILWASESIIYQRFGYGCASQHQHLSIERSRVSFTDDPGLQSHSRLLGIDEAVELLPKVYDRVLGTRPGFFTRTPTWWKEHRLHDPEHDRNGGSPMWRVLIEMEQQPVAYALYRVHPDWTDGIARGRVNVHEAVWASPDAAREMWRFLLGIDLIEKITGYGPVDDPLNLMVSDPRRIKRHAQDSLWLRIVDVPKAMDARSYATADRVVLSVNDPLFGDNDGTWELRTDGDNARCVRSDEEPDMWLSVRDLSALYLGGCRPTQLAEAGRLAARDPDVIVRFDAMLTTPLAPWCPEVF